MSNYYPKRYYKIANGIDTGMAPANYIKHQEKMDRSWLRNFDSNYELDIACDLTFRQRKEVVIDNRMQIHKMNDSFANQNISEFLHKLNQSIYKNAYKRFGKKLDVIVSLEGGKDILREDSDSGKLTHAHISIQQPNHMDEEKFIMLMNIIWIQTPWGFSQTKVSRVRTRVGRGKYLIKNSLDSISLAHTFTANHLRTKFI